MQNSKTFFLGKPTSRACKKMYESFFVPEHKSTFLYRCWFYNEGSNYVHQGLAFFSLVV